MKKIILCGAIALFGFFSANAQEVQFGAKAGVNFATVTGDETEDVSGRTAFHVGAVAEIKISDKFSFQPELLYSAQGVKEDYSENFGGTEIKIEETIKYDYLNIPLMAKYYVAEGFSIEAGPQVGFLMSAKYEAEASSAGVSESETIDLKDETSGIDFGLNFGLGYKLESGLNFGARYNLGLSNIYDGEGSDNYKIKNSVIQVSVGYFF